MPLTKRINFGLNRKTLPMIFQGEVSECGLACIAMIASYYGNRQELLTLRNQFPISQRGAKTFYAAVHCPAASSDHAYAPAGN